MSPFLADPAGVFGDAAAAVARLGSLTLALAVVLLVPGLLLGLAVPPLCRRSHAADMLALAPGLGVLALALAWWIADLAGLAVGPVLVVALAAVVVAALPVALLRVGLRVDASALWLAAIWLLTLATRLAVVRDLALPAWVDAVHHTYITRLLMEQGRVPPDYRPLLDVGAFDYHFGFHAIAAAAAQLTGAAPPDVVLAAGQFLSAAAAPSAYLLARLYGATPGGALAAAAAAGLVSMMPAYYVSWSRFTELAGLVAAPAWLLLARRATLGPGPAIVAGLASAAMLFVHPRVAVMLALLVVADLLIAPHRWPGARRWLPLALLVAVVVAAPWLDRIVNVLLPRIAAPVPGIEAANALDLAAVSTYHDPWLYGLAAAAVAAGLTAGSLAAWTAVGWLALVFVASNPAMLGLPGTYLLSTGSVVIALWLPASAALGCAAAWLIGATKRRVALVRARWLGWLAPAAVGLIGLALADAPLGALNAGTVLATPADRRALAAAARLLPPDAVVAVNAREWQLGIYMGSDAGYWIGVVTPGRAIVPPLLYPLGPPAETRATAERLARWQASGGDVNALVAQMRAMGASWLFLGEKGGSIDAARVAADPRFELLAAEGHARLYRLRP